MELYYRSLFMSMWYLPMSITVYIEQLNKWVMFKIAYDILYVTTVIS